MEQRTHADEDVVMVQEAAGAEPGKQERKGKSGLESFVFMEDTTKALQVALATGQNLVLYGKGGYGKSEYSLEFLKEIGIKPYVITMGTGMTTDRLFGGFDIKTFNESGRMEYLVENSFMNHEFVMFEELFDAPDFILEQLKDILSAGVFRNGSQIFPIKTQLIICCTNKTRSEFAKNFSLQALMERFPLEHNVRWDSHTRANYEHLLMTKIGSADPLLTYLLESYHNANHTISPRIALAAADVLAVAGIEGLQFIADFATEKELLRNCLSKFEGVIKLDKMAKEANEIIIHLKKLEKFDPMTGLASEIGSYRRHNQKLKELMVHLDSLTLDDSQINLKAEIVKKCKEATKNATAALELLV